MLKVAKTFSEPLSEMLNLIQVASDMYIRGDLKWLAGVVAGEAALSATRHDLPPQPGRQWHSPLDAWQPSAWTQLHLFRQPGPNVPICTCEQMPRRRRVVRGLRLSDAHPEKTAPPPTGSCWDAATWQISLSWDNNGSSLHAERPSDRVDKKIFHSRLQGSAVTLWLVSVSLIYKSSFFSTAQLNMEFRISRPLYCFSLFVRSCVSSPKDYSAATGDKLGQGPSRLTWSLY